MTLLLINESKKEVISLRYGDGLNKMLQLNPGSTSICPSELRRGLLQYYLAAFKDLKLIDDSSPVKIEEKDAKKENTDTDKVPEKENQTSNGEESNNNDNSNEGDSENGEVDTNNVNDNSNEGDSENGEVSSDNSQPVLTEKELTKLSAGEIKELATKLGIEVTEESTKKALIPVILDKQGNK